MGYDKPNYTQVPNALFAAMPAMGEAELRITLAISRQTFGWHKDADELSISQLMKFTGLSRQGVINGVEDGIKRGTITRRKSGNSWAFSVVVDEAVNEVDSQPSRPESAEVVNEVDCLLVNEVDTQKKDILKKESTKESGDEISSPTLEENPKVTKWKERGKEILASLDKTMVASVSSPRAEERAFVKEYSGVFAEILQHPFATDQDKQAARRFRENDHRRAYDRAWLDERLRHYRNGGGDEFRKPNGNAFWIVNAIDEDWARRGRKQERGFGATLHRLQAAGLVER